MKKILKDILRFIGSVVFYTSLAFSMTFIISSLTTKRPAFLNYQFVEVMSGSMEASEIYKGDVNLIKSKSEYVIGDIIAFEYDDIVIYHEIIDIAEDGSFVTKGSSNALPERNTTSADKVLGARVSTFNFKFIISNAFKTMLLVVTYLAYMFVLVPRYISLRKEIHEVANLQNNNLPYNEEEENELNEAFTKVAILKEEVKTSSLIIKILAGLTVAIICVSIGIKSVYSQEQITNYIVYGNSIGFVVHKPVEDWDQKDRLNGNENVTDSCIQFAEALNTDSEQVDVLLENINYGFVESFTANEEVREAFYDLLAKNQDEWNRYLYSYIINYNEDGSFDLYIIYTGSQNNDSVGPVYKTHYEKDAKGNYNPTISDVGFCKSKINSEGIRSFDASSFHSYYGPWW